jgi:natural product precursor
MKLESLKLEKFKPETLKKEQMLKLNGGLTDAGRNTVTPGGWGCGTGTVASDPNTSYSYNFGYDVDRGDGYITFHDRTNLVRNADCPTP